MTSLCSELWFFCASSSLLKRSFLRFPTTRKLGGVSRGFWKSKHTKLPLCESIILSSQWDQHLANDEDGVKNEKDYTDELSGDDWDVPGSELDNKEEANGNEDEENNYYSLPYNK